MKGSSAALSVVMAVFKITMIGIIIFFVYNAAIKAYAFGYDIFVEEAMSTGIGTAITVTVTDGKSVMEIGDILEEKGLIRSSVLFYFQEKFSPYADEIMPGAYELNTSMKPQEMINIMATTDKTEEVEGSTE